MPLYSAQKNSDKDLFVAVANFAGNLEQYATTVVIYCLLYDVDICVYFEYNCVSFPFQCAVNVSIVRVRFSTLVFDIEIWVDEVFHCISLSQYIWIGIDC